MQNTLKGKSLFTPEGAVRKVRGRFCFLSKIHLHLLHKPNITNNSMWYNRYYFEYKKPTVSLLRFVFLLMYFLFILKGVKCQQEHYSYL